MICLLLSIALGETRLRYEQELEARAMAQIVDQIDKGEHREVEQILRSFHEKLFVSDTLYANTGLLYNQRGDLDRAERYYDRALEINPNQVSALYDRAEIYLLQGQIAEAKQNLQSLLKQEEVHWVVYFRLAEIAAKEGDGKTMEEYLLRAIKSDLQLDVLVADRKTWSPIAQNPVLEPYLHRIFIVMAEERLWEQLLKG